MSVTESTALSYSAVWSAVSIISSQLGSLPLCLYKKQPGGGKIKFVAHPLYRLLHDRPNPEMSSMVFRETLQAHVLTYGNAYAEIQRNGGGIPEALWPITPDRVAAFRSESGGLMYRVANSGAPDAFIASDNMVHVPGLGFNGISGYGVIDKMRESIGLGLATEKFGAAFFGNGSTFGGVFEHPTRLSEQARKNFIESVNSRHQGVERSHKFMVVEEGMKFNRFGIDPDHAQFLETRTFQLDEVARWMNLPPHKLKQLMRSTNNNIEHQNLEYYIDCLAPWAERWEQELSYKLIAASERNIQGIEHIVSGLLRGDAAGRGTFYSQRFNTGSITPNRINELENDNPVEGGDQAFVQLGFIPLDMSRPYYEAEIALKNANAKKLLEPPPPVPPTAPNAEPDPALKREIELLTESRDTARRCAQEAEDAKDVIASELATVRADLAHLQAERDTLVTARATDLANSEALLSRYQQEVADYATINGALVAKRDLLTADVTRLTAQATSLGTDLGTATSDLAESVRMHGVIEADYQRVCGEKTALAEAHAAAVTASEADIARLNEVERGLRSDIDAMTLQMAEAVMRAEALDATYTRVCDERDALTVQCKAEWARAEGIESERLHLKAQTEGLSLDVVTAQDETARANAKIDEANQRTAITEAVVTELRIQVGALMADAETRQAALVEAREAAVRLDGERHEQGTMKDAAEAAMRAALAQVEAADATLRAVKDSLRGALSYAVQCVIRREADRARKAHQGSPDKLVKWVENFYPLHGEFCRENLRPIVRAIAATDGRDPVALLNALVPQLIEESTVQLRLMAQDADTESLGPSLERVLRLWESERADVWADRIMRGAV